MVMVKQQRKNAHRARSGAGAQLLGAAQAARARYAAAES